MNQRIQIILIKVGTGIQEATSPKATKFILSLVKWPVAYPIMTSSINDLGFKWSLTI